MVYKTIGDTKHFFGAIMIKNLATQFFIMNDWPGFIPSEAKGLVGLIRDTGVKLEKRLQEKFPRQDNRGTRLTYHYDPRSDSGGLEWSYDIQDYLASSSLSFEMSEERPEVVIIDEFDGVHIEAERGLARSRAWPEELRRVADISEEVTLFLTEEFGKSTSKRGNGCPIYRARLLDKYLEVSVPK
jgi:hypothetical protein